MQADCQQVSLFLQCRRNQWKCVGGSTFAVQKFVVAQQMDLYARSDQAFRKEEQA